MSNSGRLAASPPGRRHCGSSLRRYRCPSRHGAECGGTELAAWMPAEASCRVACVYAAEQAQRNALEYNPPASGIGTSRLAIRLSKPRL